jgi:hypothetical protein
MDSCHGFCLTKNGVIPANQHINIASSVAAVKAEKILTYTAGTDTAINVTLSTVSLFEQAYASNAIPR